MDRREESSRATPALLPAPSPPALLARVRPSSVFVSLAVELSAPEVVSLLADWNMPERLFDRETWFSTSLEDASLGPKGTLFAMAAMPPLSSLAIGLA